MRCQNDCGLLSLCRNTGNDFPHETTGLRVHAGGWLVEENHVGVPNHRHRHRQFPLVAARKSPRKFVPVSIEVHLFDLLVDGLLLVSFGKALQVVEEFQLFLHSQILDECVELRTVAEILPDLAQMLTRSEPSEVALAWSGDDFPREHLEGGRFSCPVDTKQSENFSFLYSKGEIINSNFVFFVTVQDIDLPKFLGQNLILVRLSIQSFLLFGNNIIIFNGLDLIVLRLFCKTSHEILIILQMLQHEKHCNEETTENC